MSKLYTPTFSSTRDNAFARIVGREAGEFNVLSFMRGQRVDGIIPGDVRVFVGEGELGDFMYTHVSWNIFSRRAMELIQRIAGTAVQFFGVPVYRRSTGKRIDGYGILNATRAVKCIDMARTDLAFRDDARDEIDCVYKWVFDEAAIPNDLHVFRAAEYLSALYFSEELMECMMGVEPPFKDLGFLEYGGDEVVRIVRRSEQR